MPALLTNETLQDLMHATRTDYFPELEPLDIRIGVSLGHHDFIDTHYHKRVYSISVSQAMLGISRDILNGGISRALATILIRHKQRWYTRFIPLHPKLAEQVAQQVLIERNLDDYYADYVALIAKHRNQALKAFIKKTECFLEPIQVGEIDELFTRRDKLQHLAQQYGCPKCKAHAVFPIKFTQPAAWRCSECEHEFSYEPEEIICPKIL